MAAGALDTMLQLAQWEPGCLSVVGSDGLTVVHLAVQTGDVDTVEALVHAAGPATAPALLDAGDGEGRTPLMYAALQGLHRMCRLLVRAGADPDQVDTGKRAAVSTATHPPPVAKSSGRWQRC